MADEPTADDHSPLCFFCGGNPQYTFQTQRIPYTGERKPCCLCKAMIADDEIAIFEMSEVDPGSGNPVFQPGVWYTGRWATVPKEHVVHIFGRNNGSIVLAHGYGCLRYDNYHKALLDKYPAGALH